MATGFVAEAIGSESDSGGVADPNDTPIIGFASVEIYSKKLGEIQCLAVAPDFSGTEIQTELVRECVELARAKGVMEVMAISSSDEFLRVLGFDYSLPEQKRALFYEVEDLVDPESVISSAEAEQAGVVIKPLNGYKIRRARFDEQDAIAQFLTPFFTQKKLLQRTRSEILLLMATGFVAELLTEASADKASAIIGFASVEIYSEKMSEIQCLAVSEQHQGKGSAALWCEPVWNSPNKRVSLRSWRSVRQMHSCKNSDLNIHFPSKNEPCFINCDPAQMSSIATNRTISCNY